MDVTPEHLKWALEVDKCANDFEYACHKHFHIKSKNVIGFPTFKFNAVQRFLWKQMQDQWNREGWIRQIWGKSRQVGASTISLALAFQRCNFNDYHNAFIISHDEPSSYERFDTIATFYDALPPPLRSETRYRSKSKIDFGDRRSRLLCGHARNVNVGAGEMNHVLHMSEAARYPNADQVQTSIFPSVSEARGKAPSIVIIESTSFFGGDWFKNFAEDAQAGRNGFEFHFVPYYLHDEYKRPLPPDFRMTEDERYMMQQYGMSPEAIYWRRIKRGEYANNPVLFSQEYPLSWEESWILPAGTSRTFDDDQLDPFTDILRPGKRAFVDVNGLKYSIGGPLEVWKEPIDGCFYDIGIDIAGGRTDTADWTVLEVVRRDTLEQVAEARGHWDPAGEEFLDLCYWTGMAYNRGQMIPDITGGWGHALLSDLQKRDYPNIWQWRRRDDARERVSNRVGFLYTRRDKALLVNNAVRTLQRESPTIYSAMLVDELRHFLTIGLDEWGASPGHYDDCVNAWCLALMGAIDEGRRGAPEVKPDPPRWREKCAYHNIDADLLDDGSPLGDYVERYST